MFEKEKSDMYLMHKNKFVAKLITYQGVIIGVSEVYNEKLLPIGMQGSVKFADWKILTWLTNRMIPRTRINIEEIEDEKTVWEYLKDNHGLSMNDCYWFQDVYTKEVLSWNDINFRDNGYLSKLRSFHKDTSDDQHPSILSPDYTTPGVLEKYWFRKNGRDYLTKYGWMPGAQSESVLAANEVVVTQIANILGIPCVQYEQSITDAEYTCVSECFRKRNEDIVTGQNIMDQLNSYNPIDIMSYANDLGYKKEIDQMMIIDVLVGNHDRHLSNLAFGMDADTREFTRFIPLYDNGSCLGWNRMPYEALIIKPLDLRPEEAIGFVNTYVELPDLRILINCVRYVYNNYQISEEQVKIAIRTLTSGYKVVWDAMQELKNKSR